MSAERTVINERPWWSCEKSASSHCNTTWKLLLKGNILLT